MASTFDVERTRALTVERDLDRELGARPRLDDVMPIDDMLRLHLAVEDHLQLPVALPNHTSGGPGTQYRTLTNHLPEWGGLGLDSQR